MDPAYALAVGIDCGGTTHYVCVMNRDGSVVGERQVAHRADSLATCVRWLLTLGEPDASRLLVAIEHPHGPVVELLLEQGFVVYAVNPKQLDHFRGRYTMGGAKDDRRDAWVLAHAVQTDRAAFRRVRPEDAAIVELRTLSRLDAELGDELRRTANRLREQLERYYPALLERCAGADEPWLWQVLTRAPTPVDGQRCSLESLEQVLREAHVRRFTAAELHATLAAPALHVAPGTVRAASLYVGVLLPRLLLLHQQRRDVGKQITNLLQALAAEPVGDGREHHDVTILLSLPGVGVRIGATMLAEASQPLQGRDYHAVRLLAGLAPVTKASGKRRLVTMRYTCNMRLRQACYHWARTAMQTDPRARQHYHCLRQVGHSHGRALRGVADRLLAVLIGMLRTDTLYDLHRRRAA